MIKALKATGASPEEIAGVMGQALQKNGASNEDVVRILAASMAESGASSKQKSSSPLKTTMVQAFFNNR